MAKRLLLVGLLLLIGLLCGTNGYNGVEIDETKSTPEIRAIIAEYDNDIEIYDTKLDKVVKSIQAKPEIRSLVIAWIDGADPIYVKANPFPDNGYIVKIPLDPPVAAESEWIHGSIGEIYIVLSKQDSPFYVVFDESGRVSCYNIDGDLHVLSQMLDFSFGWPH